LTPKVYLVKRGLTTEQTEKIQAALSITPLSAIVVTDPRDVNTAMELCDRAEVLHRPIAIFADFENLLTAINEDGSLCPVL
jgi:hypothetical protein